MLRQHLGHLVSGHLLVQFVFHEQHRGGAAAGQALHEFDAVAAVSALGDGVVMRDVGAVNLRQVANLVQRVMAARHRTGQRTAHTNVDLARCLLAESGVEGDDFQHLNGLQPELFSGPGHGLLTDEAEMLLEKVQHGQNGTPFGDGIVRDRLVDTGC